MKKKLVIAITITVLCMGLCACGDDDMSDTPVPEPISTQTMEQVKETTVSAQESMETESIQPESEQPKPESMEVTEETTAPDFYSGWTARDSAEVEAFAVDVRENIVNGEWEELSEKLSYPITIGVVTYYDREAFLDDSWNDIFTEDFLHAVEQDDCMELPSNENGCSIAEGCVYIFDRGENLAITRISY